MVVLPVTAGTIPPQWDPLPLTFLNLTGNNLIGALNSAHAPPVSPRKKIDAASWYVLRLAFLSASACFAACVKDTPVSQAAGACTGGVPDSFSGLQSLESFYAGAAPCRVHHDICA